MIQKFLFRNENVKLKFLSYLKSINIDKNKFNFKEFDFAMGEQGEPQDFSYLSISGYKTEAPFLSTKDGYMDLSNEENLEMTGEFKIFESYTLAWLLKIKENPECKEIEAVIQKLDKDVVIFE